MRHHVYALFFLAVFEAQGQAPSVDLPSALPSAPVHFSPLCSTGVVPEDLLKLYIEDAEMQAKTGSRRVQKRFVQENTMSFGYLFAQGRVLFNDPLSEYARGVLDTLLATRPELSSKLRLYVLKSSIVNAFTTNDGKIFLTVGLMARIRDRHQLAFVLAHEVMHYVNGDVFEAFKLQRELEKKRKSIVFSPKDRSEDLLRTKFTRSREQEIHADEGGLELYRSSRYGSMAPVGVFDLLAASQRTPFDETARPEFFARGGHLMDGVPWISPDDIPMKDPWAEGDTLKRTHPSLRYRKDWLLSMMPDTSAQSQDPRTAEVQELACYELVNVHYMNGEYVEALNCSAALLRRNGEEPFLREITVKCLFALANLRELEQMSQVIRGKRSRHKRITPVDDPYTRALDTNLHAMSAYELYAICLSNAKQEQLGRPDDPDLDHIVRACVVSLRALVWPKESGGEETEPEVDDAVTTDDTSAEEDDPGKKGRVGRSERLEEQRKAFQKAQEEQRIAEEFRTRNRKLKIRYEAKQRILDYAVPLLQDPAMAAIVHAKDPLKCIDRGGRDTTSMIVVPLALIVDTTHHRDRIIDPRPELKGYITDLPRKHPTMKMKFHPLSSFLLDADDVSRYNDYATAIQLAFSNVDGMGSFCYLDLDAANDLSSRYGSRWLTLSTIFEAKNTFWWRMGRFALLTFLLPHPGFEMGLYGIFGYRYSAFYDTRVYDLRTGEIVHARVVKRRTCAKPRLQSKKFLKSLKNWPTYAGR